MCHCKSKQKEMVCYTSVLSTQHGHLACHKLLQQSLMTPMEQRSYISLVITVFEKARVLASSCHCGDAKHLQLQVC